MKKDIGTIGIVLSGSVIRKERKDFILNMRVTQTTKNKLDDLVKRYGASRSDIVAFLIDKATESGV